MSRKKTCLAILGLLLLILGTCASIPDGLAMAMVTNLVAAGNDFGDVHVYARSGELLWSFTDTASDPPRDVCVDVSHWGHHIVVGSRSQMNPRLYLFDRYGTKLWQKSLPICWGGRDANNWESKSVSIAGYYVVAGCINKLCVYNLDGTLKWERWPMSVSCVEISHNDEYIAYADLYGDSLGLFSIDSNVPLWEADVTDTCWVTTSDPGYVAASSSSRVYLYDKFGTQIWNYRHSKWTHDWIKVDMSRDGSAIVAVNDDPADTDGCVLCYFSDMKDGTSGWSSADGTPVWTFIPTPDVGANDFYSVAISKIKNVIATGPHRNSYILTGGGSVIQNYDLGHAQSYDLDYEGNFGACGNKGGELWFFDTSSSTPLWTKTMRGRVSSVAVGRYIIYGPEPVGGISGLVDKFGLLAPYIGLASAIVVATAATAIYVKRDRRNEEKR